MSKSPILFLSLTCLVACGSESSTPANPVRGKPEQQAGLVPGIPGAETEAELDAPMTIGSLVPEGSFAWVRISSFEELSAMMDEFMAAFMGPEGMSFEAALELAPFKHALASLDRSRELGMAIGFAGESSEPQLTMMLPVTDRGAMIQALRGMPEPPQCFGIDDYVVATSLSEYRPGVGSATLTEGLPEGQVTARLDVQAVMERIGPMFEAGLERMTGSPEAGMQAVAEQLAQALRAAAQSAESADLSLAFEDGEIDFSMAFEAAPDSALDGLLPEGSGSLYDLARCANGDDSASMLLTIDTDTVQERLMPLFTQHLASSVDAGQLDAATQKVLLECGALLPLLGDSVVASIEAEGEAFDATYFCQPPDRQVFTESLEAVLAGLDRNLEALSVEGPHQEGALETAYELNFVVEGPEASASLVRMFPSGHASLRLAERRGITVITLGSDERAMASALERVARAEDELHGSLGHALKAVGDANPAFVARVDLVSTLRGLAARTEGGEELLEGRELSAEGGPRFLTYYGGVDGRIWKLGFRARVSDLVGLAVPH